MTPSLSPRSVFNSLFYWNWKKYITHIVVAITDRTVASDPENHSCANTVSRCAVGDVQAPVVGATFD